MHIGDYPRSLEIQRLLEIAINIWNYPVLAGTMLMGLQTIRGQGVTSHHVTFRSFVFSERAYSGFILLVTV
eukprot:109443-Amorphochlora_amoeboformis.AAC.1